MASSQILEKKTTSFKRLQPPAVFACKHVCSKQVDGIWAWLCCQIAGFDHGVPSNCFKVFKVSFKQTPNINGRKEIKELDQPNN